MADDSDLIAALASQDLARLVRTQEIAEEEQQREEARRRARAARSSSLANAFGSSFLTGISTSIECFILICFVTFPGDFGFGSFFQGIGQALLVGVFFGVGTFPPLVALVYFSPFSGGDAWGDAWWESLVVGSSLVSLILVSVGWRLVFGDVPFSAWLEVTLVSIGIVWVWIAISAWRHEERPAVFGSLAAIGGVVVAVGLTGFLSYWTFWV